MSFTYRIACTLCREALWIGQGWPDRTPDTRVIYSSDEGLMEDLRDFLYRHETTRAAPHALIFCSTESEITAEFTDFGAEQE